MYAQTTIELADGTRFNPGDKVQASDFSGKEEVDALKSGGALGDDPPPDPVTPTLETRIDELMTDDPGMSAAELIERLGIDRGQGDSRSGKG